jgi:ATPase components of ABC transporters with duplicated ATPase domains
MILSCQNLNKSFGTNIILKQASFHIEDHEKSALIGSNGAGKSTMLKIIAGEMESDTGSITISNGKTLGYLNQHQEMDLNTTIYEELLEIKRPVIELETQLRELELAMKQSSDTKLEELLAQYTRKSHEFESLNGYAYKSEVIGILKGLGFTTEDFSRSAAALSGGQKTRIALGKLLLLKPDILLLDEPTNHLDMDSIAWLENFLLRYDGAVLIVSHDRYFLDRTVTKILSLEQHELTVFMGNYSQYAEKRENIYRTKLNAYLNQQRELKHQEEVIAKLRSFNREKSIKRAESREKLIAKTDILDKPIDENTEMNITLVPDIESGNDVLHIENLSKSFPCVDLFSHLDLDLKRKERVAIIGQNGTGKTTILKIINNLLTPDDGTITLGSNVHIGYYDQEHLVLDADKNIFEEISDTYPTLSNTRIRNVLAAFLFTGDDVFQKIETLSGGERGRVSLAKLMLSNANLLILDEPTNHLDIVSKEILERALSNYTGTVLYVSHDRYFVNRTATRIVELTNQKLVNYIGNYDYYLEKKEVLTAIYAPKDQTTSASEITSDNKLNWQQQKETQALERKRQSELERLEKEIEQFELREKAIDEQFELPSIACDVAKCQELSLEKETISSCLAKCYQQWEDLA